jgi:hypothetical protein
MARERVVETLEDEWLSLARGRINLPVQQFQMKYEVDVDLLYIILKESPHPTRTRHDVDDGVLYHYEGTELVSIEILDLYGVFVS